MPEKNTRPVHLAADIHKFCHELDKLISDCDEAIEAVHLDRFMDFLERHEKVCTIFFGVLGAVVPIGSLLLWHLSRGGSIF